MDSLFDTSKRTYTGMSRFSEPHYSFWNRSARPDIELCRSKFDDWYRDYPDSHKVDLKRAFQSKVNGQHKSAAFELLIYAYFRALGAEIEIHPDLKNGSPKRPDFLITPSSGEQFVVEVARCGLDALMPAAKNLCFNQFRDHLDDRLQGCDVTVSVSLRDYGNIQPSAKKTAEKIRSMLRAGRSDFEIDVGATDWNIGLHVRLAPYGFYDPTAKFSRRLHIVSFAGFFGSHEPAITSKLNSKGTRYGRFDFPYVIAFNVENDFTLDVNPEVVLFGGAWPHLNSVLENSKGLWLHKGRPQCRRVSGVLLGTPFLLLNFPRSKFALHLNPHATHPLNGFPIPATTFEYTSSGVQQRPGTPLHKVLGVPVAWPDLEQVRSL